MNTNFQSIQPNSSIELPPSKDYSSAGGLEPITLQQAIETFKRDGYVILENLIPDSYVESLRLEYQKTIAAKVGRFNLTKVDYYDERANSNDNVLNDFKPEGGNHDLNRWNMHLPTVLPFFDEMVFSNPSVLQLVDALLGKDCVCYLIASDTPYPGAGFQSIHQDFSRFSIAVNIPLVDITENNAPMEIWPGTHRPDLGGSAALFSTDPYYISPEEKMREIVASVSSRQMLMKAGSVLVRDHRLVHRGTANKSDSPRPMLSIYYTTAHPVPYRWISDLGVRVALFLRRVGRGQGKKIQYEKIFNLGNILGRVVEESSLTDRDYRRRIPLELWEQYSPHAKYLLRYASVESGKKDFPFCSGSLIGTYMFLVNWSKNITGYLVSVLFRHPRKADYN